jgi:hypothetical protein
MIYIANRYGAEPDFYVPDQATMDLLPTYFAYSSVQIGTAADAQAQLQINRQNAIVQNDARFSICAIFVNGSDSVWREMRDDDPEEYEYKVFNHTTGVYSTHYTKTDALRENSLHEEEFLTLFGMNAVQEMQELPVETPPS